MVKLIKSLDVMAGNVTRGQIMTNAQRTEEAINQQELAFNKHKTEDDNAHTTRQIKQGAKSQEDINKDLQSQIGRLVLAPRNNSANEIVQARVNMFGEEFETLKENINDWQERTHIDKEEVLSSVQQATKEVLDIEYRFEPDKQEFLYVTNLAPLTNAVMQSFWIDNRAGIVYMTQAITGGYRITRLRPNGQFIDSSDVMGGGHGTHNGYRYINDDLWIYSHIKNGNNENTIVRFKYKPNITYTYGSYGMEDVYTGHPEKPYITPVINEEEGLILFRIQPTDVERDEEEEYQDVLNYVEVRRLEDIDNRVNNILYKMNVPMSLTGGVQPMQGVTFADKTLYWWSGNYDPANPNFLTAFNLETGKQIYQTKVDIGGFDGTYAGGIAEPEGMQMYYDRDTGKKALLLGVVNGGSGHREHKIFSVGQRGILESLHSRGVPFIMNDTGGRVRPLPINPSDLKNLTQIQEPGYYYLYTSNILQIDDFPLPAQWRDAGWFLDVYPPNMAGGSRQVLTRLSNTRNMVTFERFVDKSGNTSQWNYISKQGGFAERCPSFINKMEDLNIVGMSFYLTTADTNRLSGFPNSLKGATAWICHVEPLETGGFTQRLVRNSVTATIQILIKNYHADGNHSNWNIFRGEEIN